MRRMAFVGRRFGIVALVLAVSFSNASCAAIKWLDEPTIVDKQRQANAEAAAQTCIGSGIELMGIYKNEIFDRAMGGGVVEWLVKIRNNSAVTKIVQFGWVDEYGQNKTGQVQVQGGQIASPRVDMQQARAIPPVKNPKLLSCQ